MAYVALYRKWRPKSFADLVGQEHISRTLANAILSEKIGHAYLFAGPRGTGKTSTAKIFAKALNCDHGPTPEPCNVCPVCKKINEGASMDVFEIDAASNRGIDEIRDLRETVKFAPVDGRYKVYIIDEVHMLTAEAFNALLKTLEEPPTHVVFILATTEAHKVPATIQSRCQRYDFKRITVDHIQARLSVVADSTGIQADDEALKIIAVHADGGLRDALSILDQCAALADKIVDIDTVRRILGLVGHEWIWKLTEALADRSAAAVLKILTVLLDEGKDVKQILSEMILHMRSVMIYKAVGPDSGNQLYGDDETVLAVHAGRFSHEEIAGIIQKLHVAVNEMKWSAQPRITLEVTMLGLCHAANPGNTAALPGDIQELERRIEKLEAKIVQLTAGVPQAVLKPGTVVGKIAKDSRITDLPGDSSAQTVPTVSRGGEYSQTMAVSPQAIHADGQIVWKNLLSTLQQRGRMPLLACVKQGVPCGMNQGQFQLAFKSSFLKARTEREDYRGMLEEVLQEICGHEMRLICVLDTAPASSPSVKPQAVKETKSSLPQKDIPKKDVVKKPEVEVNYEAMTAEERHTLQTAVQVFGDNFVREEDLK
jgi:DNA polymerase III, subunit gamma and tau